MTKQKMTEENLANALEDLREVDKLKEEFSTMISHELKTPLTPIKFSTEMLLESGILGTLNQDQLDAVKEIEINSTRLENLITDILYAQKLDMGRMFFDITKFNPRDLIEHIAKNLLPIIQEKGIELEIKNSFAGNIFSDENRIQQVMENLIKNSVDFVPEEGGKISIETQNSHDFVTFSVKDNGIGIPKDKKSFLFNKFYQVDTTYTRKHGGTGLGLVICKGFVEALGGEIWFESEEGKGTTFFFTIPKKQEIEIKNEYIAPLEEQNKEEASQNSTGHARRELEQEIEIKNEYIAPLEEQNKEEASQNSTRHARRELEQEIEIKNEYIAVLEEQNKEETFQNSTGHARRELEQEIEIKNEYIAVLEEQNKEETFQNSTGHARRELEQEIQKFKKSSTSNSC